MSRSVRVRRFAVVVAVVGAWGTRETSSPRSIFPRKGRRSLPRPARAIALSGDGRRLYVTDTGKTLAIVDLTQASGSGR